ncbi:N-acetylmuramyl-L-alanine amidase, negative regulator of AmpC, AmpD [Paraglaciecola sp. T6c]|uniref:1,6-anhydro-N-acetylmuramyl-L-alanine amidase AmpD n=1 Tax=Pseudoalteromonas atlantica (strain T6c / ATCC BAA-1087) TaxID=3042615 RepID=UPI00005C68FE|nr:1,6-anhydro-N-acetylmuramyl-L-alanine amidase AmpD [Paraglaciecola sp. T6c]ABG41853.1 N-acetylmuramyl-L-alanine amidase, negative regulator of AmpC, AmpD [Paraglaciecola sp. T6c]
MLSSLSPSDIFTRLTINQHSVVQARHITTTHKDERPDPQDISVLVIHNISLPPNQFDNSYIEDFFVGKLDPAAHPFFEEIHQMRVSAHCVIKRNGEVIQFVPFDERAWHAGVSSFQGRERCNDYSIGIELEGTDDSDYTTKQYDALEQLAKAIMLAYPKITLGRIVGHNDIAPGRKTDPGRSFNWQRLRQGLCL